LYVTDLAALIEEHDLSPHHYTNDTQIYDPCSPSHVDEFSTKVYGCRVRQRSCRVDAIESATAKPGQDRASVVVLNQSTPAPAFNHYSEDWFDDNRSSFLSP